MNTSKNKSLPYKSVNIGILGVHGSREEHALALKSLGAPSIVLRSPEDFKKIDGIILPGGESTSFGRLLQWSNLLTPLKKAIFEQNIPVFGTCAGAILLSQKGSEYGLSALDIEINRNAYGRQIDSFSESIQIDTDPTPFHAVFIRAPQILSCGKEVQILASYNKTPVLVQEKNRLACTFHPELTKDFRIHDRFLSLCIKHSIAS